MRPDALARSRLHALLWRCDQIDADEKLDAEPSPDADVEARQDVDEKPDVELSPDGVTVERQDNSDLAAEQCGLGELRPHLQEVSIPTPVVDLETEYAAHVSPPPPRIEETHANVAHEDTIIAEFISLTEEGRVGIGGTSSGRRSL